jgi:Ni,Fe-hydrogenase maturation factor
MKILVFGNQLVEKDSVALRIMPKLQKKFPEIEFREFDAVEELEKEGPELFILDAVEGIKQCELITDLSVLQKTSRNVSMHDFDLGQTLVLLHKMGIVKKMTILGVPTNYGPGKATKEISRLIEVLQRN